jgi:subtilisin family serine protease
LDWYLQPNTLAETKAPYSSCGPRVDVFAPGSAIFGGYRNYLFPVAQFSSQLDPRSSLTPGKSYYLFKLSGTSQATPQVTGVLALVAEQYPNYAQADMLNYLATASTASVLTELGLNLNPNPNYLNFPFYSNATLLQGAANRLLFAPAAVPTKTLISGGDFIGGSIQ